VLLSRLPDRAARGKEPPSWSRLTADARREKNCPRESSSRISPAKSVTTTDSTRRCCASSHGLPQQAHPWAGVAVVASMSAFYTDTMDIHNRATARSSRIRIIAKLPHHSRRCAQAFRRDSRSSTIEQRLEFAANVLHMLFAVPASPTGFDPIASEARRSCCSSCSGPPSMNASNPRPCASPK